jgi:hypothetical protein
VESARERSKLYEENEREREREREKEREKMEASYV